MNVNVDLPTFPEDDKRVLNVMSGIEHRAKKQPDKPWEVKTKQCNGCGECCKMIHKDWTYGVDPETGWCAHLKYSVGHDDGKFLGWLCDYGASRPLSCSLGDFAGEDYCSVEWG